MLEYNIMMDRDPVETVKASFSAFTPMPTKSVPILAASKPILASLRERERQREHRKDARTALWAPSHNQEVLNLDMHECSAAAIEAPRAWSAMAEFRISFSNWHRKKC